MKLMCELHINIVAVSSAGVLVRPEYWHEGRPIIALEERLVSPGEALIWGPHMTEVEFHPPTVGG